MENMENTSASPGLCDDPNKSSADDHKPGKGKRLKAKYRTLLIDPSSTEEVSGILRSEDVHSVKAGDPVTSEKLLSEHESSRKPIRIITPDTSVSDEELRNGASTTGPSKVDPTPSGPPTGQVLKRTGVAPMDRHRKKIAVISGIILFVAIVVSIIAASGIFKEGSPAQPNNTTGTDDGNVVRTALAKVMKTVVCFTFVLSQDVPLSG